MLLLVFYTLKSRCDLTLISGGGGFLCKLLMHNSLTIRAKSCLWYRCFCKQFPFVTEAL